MWYVSWAIMMCVKDCTSATDLNCGGLASKWDPLYETDDDCCASKLGWVDRKDCTAKG